MTTQTAEQAYNEALLNYEKLLYALDKKVSQSAANSEGHRHWAHVGDLNAIAEALREITEGK